MTLLLIAIAVGVTVNTAYQIRGHRMLERIAHEIHVAAWETPELDAIAAHEAASRRDAAGH